MHTGSITPPRTPKGWRLPPFVDSHALRQKAEHDPEPSAGDPEKNPHVYSVAERLLSFQELARLQPNQNEWYGQLREALPYARTAQDIQDWIGFLTPDLCKAHPDLLQRLSEQLCHLLPSFTPKQIEQRQIEQSLNCCLSFASSVGMSEGVWMSLCVTLASLPLPAMKALLNALEYQEFRWRSPEGGNSLIKHVHNVINGMERLTSRGFRAKPDTALGTPIEAPGAATNDAPILNHDVLSVVMGHVLKLGDRQCYGSYSQLAVHNRALQPFARVAKEFFPRSASMLAHNRWVETMLLRKLRGQEDYKLDEWIDKLVDLDAQAVSSLRPFTPTATQRRLDMLLRDLLIGATVEHCFPDHPKVADIYSSLHDRAVIQLATQGWKPACFAAHLRLSALPLHALTIAFLLLADSNPDIVELFELIAGDFLSVYPEDVQAQTLMSLLLSANVLTFDNPPRKQQILARLTALMGKADWQPDSRAHAWLRVQWNHFNDMLALIEVPDTVFVADAANVPDELLEGLQQYHGVGQDSGLLIEDPFAERYVLWTPADISLLSALCKRAEKSIEWKPPARVDCLVNLLRQLCLVSREGDEFVKPGLMAAFPIDILKSAFQQLTPQEQSLVLVRDYSGEDVPRMMELITLFMVNRNIALEERKSCLRRLELAAKDHDIVFFLQTIVQGTLTRLSLPPST